MFLLEPARKKNPYCAFYWQEQHVLLKAGVRLRWMRGEGGQRGMGGRQMWKKTYSKWKERNLSEKESSWGKTRKVCEGVIFKQECIEWWPLTWVTLCRLRGKKHAAYIWSTSRRCRSRPKVERRSAVSSWATQQKTQTRENIWPIRANRLLTFVQNSPLCGYGGWVRLTWLSQMPPRDVSVCLHWCFRTNTWQTGRTCSLDCAQPTLILRQYRCGCSLGLTLKSLGERGHLFKVNQREAEE